MGTVYGRHLQRGGADLSYLVRPEYADAVRGGLTVYALNKSGKRRNPERFVPDDVLTTADAIASTEPFDQVWLCISATALRAGVFIADLSRAVTARGGSPAWVLLTPGLDDSAFLAAQVQETHIVQGMVSMISYQAPLEGSEERVPEPGVAYYVHPGARQPFSGERRRARAVVASLVAGGLAARVVPDAAQSASMASAVMMPHLLALQACGWSFAALKRRPELLQLASEGSQEASAVVAAHRGDRSAITDLMGRAAQPWLLKLLMTVGPRVAPFDLEAYVEHHFTKTHDQTLYMMTRYLSLGDAQGRDVSSLHRLMELVA